MLYTNLRCFPKNHGDRGGDVFPQVSGESFCQSDKNYITLMAYHYCKYHLGWTGEDIAPLFEEAKEAVKEEYRIFEENKKKTPNAI